MLGLLFFFFKQKTAYEMRISDWSSDVCSSDLCASSSTAATIPSGWSIRAIPSSGRRVSGSAHDGRFSEVLTHPRDDGVMIGASLRALLALFAILTATAVIAPADRKSTRLNSSH